MKRLNNSKISIVLFVFIAAIVLGGSAHADFTFGEPVSLESVIPVFDPAYDGIDCFSYDGLEVFISSNRPNGHGDWDLWVSKRTSTDADWGPPENLGAVVNSSKEDSLSSISADGLTLYFCSNRPNGQGYDIYMTTRATRNDPWGPPVNLGANINSSASDGGAWILPDDLELYFISYKNGGNGRSDIYVAKRATTDDPWGMSTNLGSIVNSAYSEHWHSLSPDGLLLLFSDHANANAFRLGGYGKADMWMTRRASISDPWETPVNLGPVVNSASHDGVPRISPDGHTLYFWTDRSGSWETYQSPIIPICDFDDNEIVDINDLVILIDNWGTSESLCDIGPMPWGDGVVDKDDLDVLMSHWGQEVEFLPFNLIAYWRLDETEGDTAYDSVGYSDGTVHNSAAWQPEVGIFNGSIELNGIDGYISTPFILNPYSGPFSVSAWIKSDVSGKVILSQQSGANWLLTDYFGRFMTELKAAGTSGKTLVSQAIITDGNWHRIGFVRDGTSRILYVDDVEVARDTQTYLLGSINELYIGAGKGLESGKFFSGLIDDVRIYNQAIVP